MKEAREMAKREKSGGGPGGTVGGDDRGQRRAAAGERRRKAGRRAGDDAKRSPLRKVALPLGTDIGAAAAAAGARPVWGEIGEDGRIELWFPVAGR